MHLGDKESNVELLRKNNDSNNRINKIEITYQTIFISLYINILKN